MSEELVRRYKAWLSEHGYSPTSIRAMASVARKVRCDLPPEQALAEFERFLASSGYAPSTAAGMLSGARTFLRFLTGRHPRGSRPPHPSPGEDFWLYLRYQRGLADGTSRGYARMVGVVMARWQETGLDPRTLTKADLVRTLEQVRQKGLSPSTVNKYIHALRAWFDFAAEQGLRQDNPARSLRGPRVPEPLPRALEVSQVLRLLESVPPGPHPLDLRDRAILEVLAASGLRAAELAGLSLGDFFPSQRQLRVLGKGGRLGLAYLSGRAAGYLGRYLERGRPQLACPGEEAIFVTRQGTRMSPHQVWCVVRTRGVRAGVACYPHMLRHSLATMLLEGGMNLRYVQAVLRHARLQTTQVYTLVRPERVRESYLQALPIQ